MVLNLTTDPSTPTKATAAPPPMKVLPSTRMSFASLSLSTSVPGPSLPPERLRAGPGRRAPLPEAEVALLRVGEERVPAVGSTVLGNRELRPAPLRPVERVPEVPLEAEGL